LKQSHQNKIVRAIAALKPSCLTKTADRMQLVAVCQTFDRRYLFAFARRRQRRAITLLRPSAITVQAPPHCPDRSLFSFRSLPFFSRKSNRKRANQIQSSGPINLGLTATAFSSATGAKKRAFGAFAVRARSLFLR